MVICALLPRFELMTALDGRARLLGQAVALAPEPGGSQVVGEASGAAEAYGIHAGMRLGEALARCPGLMLVTPDRARAEAAWEKVLRRLESIGARVESSRGGEAFFEADELRELWGDERRVIDRARRELDAPARFGAGPSRFCAYAAAREARPRGRAVLLGGDRARRFLAAQPVELLRGWTELDLDQLERLGLRTLGELAALPRAALADRFGGPGLEARKLALGGGRELLPRRPGDRVSEQIELPDAVSGPQLAHALEVLVHRLLGNPARRGRSLRRLRLAAALAGGGSWSSDVPLRRAGSSPERLRLALEPRLEALPGPARWLGLQATAFGPAVRDQLSLTDSRRQRRRERLGEAVRQVRAAAGRESVLRVLELDPASHLPERRLMLAPW